MLDLAAIEGASVDEAPRPLNIPHAESVRYERNFITQAVCEFRFPTLLELEEKKPVKLQANLRKEYPEYISKMTVTVAPGAPPDVFYAFASANRKWLVSLKAHSASLETTSYTEFSDFYSRLERLLSAALPVIDTDFFTRVGLRYVNTLPIGSADNFAAWVNPDLMVPLVKGVYGSITQASGEVRGFTSVGQYSFRHGISEGKQEYTLDFDFFKEGVPVKDALGLVREFNALNYSFFHYCLGPKALEYLGAGKPKRKCE